MVIRTPVRRTKQWLRQLFSPASCGSGSSSTKSNQQRESVFDKLPVDIIHQIHSLLPVRDAARAACVSRWFLHLWRRYSNHTLSAETLGLTDRKSRDTETFAIHIIDHVLKKHSGIGVEILQLHFPHCKHIEASYLDSWFQIAVCSGIKEITLILSPIIDEQYTFPCSVLSDDAVASSLQILELNYCAFRPTAALGCLRRLRRLYLAWVHITEEELEHFLSKSLSLEQIHILHCNQILSLRIPCTLQKLKFLRVTGWTIEAVEISAPNVSSFYCTGKQVEISVADPWQLKNVSSSCSAPDFSTFTLSFAGARLPDLARDVKSLTMYCFDESVNTPIRISTFPSLKKLEINLSFCQIYLPAFDVLSLVSFLDASPALDSFILNVGEDALNRADSVVNANYVRWEPQHQHDHLRHVAITGFCSAKNLVQFVIYILESAPSLECLTLDATPLYSGECGTVGKMKSFCWMNMSNIVEAGRALKAAERYIAERVPSGVRFQIM